MTREGGRYGWGVGYIRSSILCIEQMSSRGKCIGMDRVKPSRKQQSTAIEVRQQESSTPPTINGRRRSDHSTNGRDADPALHNVYQIGARRADVIVL